RPAPTTYAWTQSTVRVGAHPPGPPLAALPPCRLRFPPHEHLGIGLYLRKPSRGRDFIQQPPEIDLKRTAQLAEQVWRRTGQRINPGDHVVRGPYQHVARAHPNPLWFAETGFSQHHRFISRRSVPQHSLTCPLHRSQIPPDQFPDRLVRRV